MRTPSVFALALLALVGPAFSGSAAGAADLAKLKPIVTGDPVFDKELRRLHQETVAAERGMGPAPDYDALFRGRHQALYDRATTGHSSQGEVYLGLMKLAVLSPAWSGYPTRYAALRDHRVNGVAEVAKAAWLRAEGKPERVFYAFAAMTPALYSGDYELALKIRDELLAEKTVWIPSASDGYRLAVWRNFRGAGRVAIKLKLHHLENPGAEACLGSAIPDALTREVAILLGQVRRDPNPESFKCLKVWPETARRNAGQIAVFARCDNPIYRKEAREVLRRAGITAEHIAEHTKRELREDKLDSPFDRYHNDACFAAANIADDLTCLATFDSFLAHGGLRRRTALSGLRLLADRGMRREAAKRILPVVKEEGGRAILRFRHVLRACGPEVAELGPEIIAMIASAIERGMPSDFEPLRELGGILGAMGGGIVPKLLEARRDEAMRPVIDAALERIGGSAIEPVVAARAEAEEATDSLDALLERVLARADGATFDDGAIAAVSSLTLAGPERQRILAIEVCGRLGARASAVAPRLVKLAEQPAFSLPAMTSLYSVQPAAWRELYLAALNGDRLERAEMAIRSIGAEPSAPDLAALVKCVGRREPPSRALEGAAFDTLKRLGSSAEPALPLIRRALESKDPGRILDGLSVLHAMTTAGVGLADAVLACLDHPNARIRGQAASLLPLYGERSRPVLPRIVRWALDAPDAEFYRALLAQLGKPAVDAIYDAFQVHEKDFGRTPRAELTKAEVKEIVAVRKHNHRLSRVLREASKQRIDWIYPSLEAEAAGRRALTIMVLAQIAAKDLFVGDTQLKVFKDVAARLEDDSPCVRDAAVRALPAFGRHTAAAVAKLAAVLGKGSPSLTYAALVTLKDMGERARPAASALRRLHAAPPTPRHAALAAKILEALGVDVTAGEDAEAEDGEEPDKKESDNNKGHERQAH